MKNRPHTPVRTRVANGRIEKQCKSCERWLPLCVYTTHRTGAYGRHNGLQPVPKRHSARASEVRVRLSVELTETTMRLLERMAKEQPLPVSEMLEVIITDAWDASEIGRRLNARPETEPEFCARMGWLPDESEDD